MLESVLSMAAFALAASLSPGPVNLVALSGGLNYGLRPTLRHVTGATLGFTLLLVLVGLGLHTLLLGYSLLMDILRWAGIAFLLYMALGLARDRGIVAMPAASTPPSLLRGALMQWLNPKAWIASIAGMGAYTTESAQAGLFAALFFLICYASITTWAALGAWLGREVSNVRWIRWLNRTMAVLLVASALALALMPGGDTVAESLPSAV